jgi:hypothetical protein
MNPAIKTLSPVPTLARVEILANRTGTGLGDGVGVGVPEHGLLTIIVLEFGLVPAAS